MSFVEELRTLEERRAATVDSLVAIMKEKGTRLAPETLLALREESFRLHGNTFPGGRAMYEHSLWAPREGTNALNVLLESWQARNLLRNFLNLDLSDRALERSWAPLLDAALINSKGLLLIDVLEEANNYVVNKSGPNTAEETHALLARHGFETVMRYDHAADQVCITLPEATCKELLHFLRTRIQ